MVRSSHMKQTSHFQLNQYEASDRILHGDFNSDNQKIDAVLAANPDKVAQYQGGKTGLIGFFVGQCMKEMRGQGNPKLINELLVKKLG